MVRAVVVAAGRSRRMGEGVDKQLLLLDGRPVLAHSLAVLEECPDVTEYVVVAGAGAVAAVTRLARQAWGCRKLAGVAPGGETRRDSVWEGLQALPDNTRIVVVHDGARPFLQAELVGRVVDAAVRWGAATLAVPARETVKEADAGGFVLRTVPRENLWLTQTPQAFSFPLLREAHRRARAEGLPAPDDASLVEALGHRVKVVEGSPLNLKITTPEDLILAQAIARVRAGGLS